MRAKNKLVYGFGVNDAEYKVREGQSICKFYETWSGMIERCYSARWLKKNPSYAGCSVCDEWSSFIEFKSWMETQDWAGKHLDKDILVRGNRVYSPSTCVFVSALTNSFINEYSRGRGGYLLGVDKHAQCSRFRSRCSNPFTGENEYLGLYISEMDAHMAWKARKLEHAKVIASMQDDCRVADAIVKRYA